MDNAFQNGTALQLAILRHVKSCLTFDFGSHQESRGLGALGIDKISKAQHRQLRCRLVCGYAGL
jgi:hypothetical protein